MKSEVNSSSPQINKQGRRRLSKRKTELTHKATATKSTPWRLFFFPAKPKKEPSSTVNEDPRSPLGNKKSPKPKPIASCAPLAKDPSSEHLIYIHPSSQLQEYQSVSCHTTEDRKQIDEIRSSSLRIYKTQSQWLCPATSSQQSGLSTGASTVCDSSEKPIFNRVDSMDPGDRPVIIARDLWCDQVVDSVQGVGQYEHDHPKDNRNTNRAHMHINTNTTNQSPPISPSTKTPPNKKHTFQPRLERNTITLPLSPPPPSSRSHPQPYKSPTRVHRLNLRTIITTYWHSLKNKSTTLFTSLQDSGTQIFKHQGVNTSLVSLTLNDSCATQASKATRRDVRSGNRDRDRRARGCGGGGKEGMRMRGRKSSLFLDVDVDLE
jgi:hypothetical protein